MSALPNPGLIITFYSYKGGTGRSMALANVACLLSQRQTQAAGRRVLLVDWDLEAPGLHRFFRDRFRRQFGTGNDYTEAVERQPGLIDLFWKLREVTGKLSEQQSELSLAAERELREELDLRSFIIETDIDSLHLLKAGQFGEDYPRRVNTFDWEDLYNRTPWLIPWFASWLAENYEYVLIDSRTGVTDTSGICTMLLPEKLVVVFTPNLQSTVGANRQIQVAIDYRRRSDDLRPLLVYPLPSRIETTLPTLRDRWRFDPECGYQPRIEALFRQIYGLAACDLTEYFNEMQVPQVPDYAYGEEIAVLVERGADKYSLTNSYTVLTERLLSATEPWEKPGSAETNSVAQDTLRRAYALMTRLSAEEAETARRVFTRLVQVMPNPEVGSDTPKRVRRGDLAEAEDPIFQLMVEAGVLRLLSDGTRSEDPLVELADPALVSEWTHFKDWIEKDRRFLVWRQRLDDGIEEWRSRDRNSSFLLAGNALDRALEMAGNRQLELNEIEIDYIKESLARREQEKEEQEQQAQRAFELSLDEAAERRSRFLVYCTVVIILFCIAAFYFASPNKFTDNSDSYSAFREIFFLDQSHGWIVGFTNNDELCFFTTNGGETWARRKLGVDNFSPFGIYFVNAKHGWVAGSGGIGATDDGGTTWKQALPESLLSPLPGLNAIRFVTPEIGWAVGIEILSDPEKEILLKTTNGGVGWSKQTLPTTLKPKELTAVYFVDSDSGWVVGREGFIVATHDGGTTWFRQQIGDSKDFESVFFIDREVGWVGGDSGIFGTRDGGKTWHKQDQAASYIHSLFFLDARTGWAAGLGSVFATHDGGITWEEHKVSETKTPSLSSIRFIDPQKGWAVSDDTELFMSDDGGKSWVDRTASLPGLR